MKLKKQDGVALLLSLVILLVLSLLAISGMQGSVMQERMATAQRDGVMALEVAETAVAEVEGVLDNLDDLDDFGTATGFYNPGDGPDVFDYGTWTDDSTLQASSVGDIVPRYYVEYMGKVVLDEEGQLPRDMGEYSNDGEQEMDYARIVVMTTGPSGQSRRIVESFFVFSPEGLGIGGGS